MSDKQHRVIDVDGGALTVLSTYKAEVGCVNCGFVGIAEIPLAVRCCAATCPNCHCKHCLRPQNAVRLAAELGREVTLTQNKPYTLDEQVARHVQRGRPPT